MPENKDYTQWTLEALLIEEKKLRNNEKLSAGLIGILFGIMIYGIVKNGFGFLYIAIPVVLIAAISKNAQVQKQDLKQIKLAISAKNSK